MKSSKEYLDWWNSRPTPLSIVKLKVPSDNGNDNNVDVAGAYNILGDNAYWIDSKEDMKAFFNALKSLGVSSPVKTWNDVLLQAGESPNGLFSEEEYSIDDNKSNKSFDKYIEAKRLKDKLEENQKIWQQQYEIRQRMEPGYSKGNFDPTWGLKPKPLEENEDYINALEIIKAYEGKDGSTPLSSNIIDAVDRSY